MNEQFIKNIKVLQQAIVERRLVVFAGAGISVDSGVPSWSELVQELRSEIDIPASETDFLRIAQMYCNERQQKEFIDKVREVLKYKKLRYNEIHEAIFELNPEYILTTNFDDLLEQVIKAKAYPFSVVTKDSEFPYVRNTKLLVKIHGDLEEANLVIKEDDYLEYAERHPLIESFLKGVFANKIVLFIGYSFSDMNLKILLQRVRNILGSDFQNAYLLSTEAGLHHAKRQYLKNKGINIIHYADPYETDGQDWIVNYLSGKNALNYELYKQKSLLSEEGSKLLRMIQLIAKYLDFAEGISQLDPLTQMSKSLERFSEFRVLPPNFLSNLFPFNTQKKYSGNYDNYILGSNNTKINQFFFEDIDTADLTLKDSYFSKHAISVHRRSTLENKLHKVVEKLNYSSIFYFGKGRDHNHPLLNLKSGVHVEIVISQPVCECPTCLYNDGRFKEFLKALNQMSITETSEVQNDLMIAYSHYKASNFKTAYSLFEEIGNKSWQVGNYMAYYIAKHNIKQLRNFINWGDEALTDESRQSIVKKIDDMDLDKLLFQIPQLDNDQLALLKKIRDNDVLIKIEAKINEYYEKIVGVHEIYEKDGFSSGPFYPALIEHQLTQLFFFYTYNYLVEDEYPSFVRVVQKAIKAFLICYAIDDRYHERLPNFHFRILRYLIFYGNNDSLLKTFDRYNIETVQVSEQSLPESIRFLNNWFESTFNEKNIFGTTIELDAFLASQTNNFSFREKIRNITHNTLLVFSGIELPNEDRRPVIQNLFRFLRVQNILVRSSAKYLNKFLCNLKGHFTFQDLMDLLHLTVETPAPYANDDFFDIISFIIAEYHPKKRLKTMN